MPACLPGGPQCSPWPPPDRAGPPASLLPPPCAGARRLRVKVALNVAASDLLMVLSEDRELPWLEGVLSRAAQAPVVVAAE